MAQVSAPLVLFPLAVGGLLGAACVPAARACGVTGRASLAAGALLAALAAAGTLHFRSFSRAHAAHAAALDHESDPERRIAITAMRPADSFLGYLHEEAARGRPLGTGEILRGTEAWASWLGDAALLALAAVGASLFLRARLVCPRCGGWKTTVRRGDLSAGRLARLRQWPLFAALPQNAPQAVYRWRGCAGGCTSGQLAISWSRGALEFELTAADAEAARHALDA